MSEGWRFKTEWMGDEVWVYSLSEPAGVSKEISGDAASAEIVELPGEIERTFGYPNGEGSLFKTILVDIESGEIVGSFSET